MAIAEDGSTPAVATASNDTTGVITSAAFSPPASSLLVATVNVGYFSAGSGTASITITDSAGGTWTAGPFLGDGAADNSGIWFRYLSSAPGLMTVTATNSNHPAAGYQLSVRVLTGAASAQAGAGSATHATTTAATAATSAITTTTAGSWVYVAACGNSGSSFTAAAATTLISNFTDSTDAECMASGRATAATGTPGATTLGFTAAAAVKSSWAALEILPAGTTPAAGLATAAAAAPDPAVSAVPGAPAGLASAAATAPAPTVSTPKQAFPPAATAAATAPAPAVSFNLAVQAGLATASAAAPVPQARSSVFVGFSGGAGRPMPLPGASQVAVAPPGSQAWRYLGSLGHVTGLRYSFVMPGGADKMSCTVQVPAAYRTQLMNVGWQVRVYRGGHVCWTGRTDEPAPGPDGWSVTAVGDGQRAADFAAVYSGTWPSGQPDDAINQAITRGLPWANPGVGQPSWAWLGQPQDSGAQTVKAMLDVLTLRGGGTWYVNSGPGGPAGAGLALLPVPSAVNRLLLCTTPVPRTLGGDVNRLFLRYQTSADNTTTGAVAGYALTSVTGAASVAAHQATEAFLDLASAGVMSAGAAQAVGNAILTLYQRASFAGPFTATPGQLMTTGGQPIDPGTDQAGTVVKLILTDFAFGGEVAPGPVQFPVGGYEWDDQHQVAQVTPFQTLNQSFSGLAGVLTAAPAGGSG